MVAIFSNWYWNFQPSRFLVSYNVIFSVGSTWLTLLPFQTLRTYSNQYPRQLETLQSLQWSLEGIPLSFLLPCPSKSANDLNHCRTYAIWHGSFVELMPFGMGTSSELVPVGMGAGRPCLCLLAWVGSIVFAKYDSICALARFWDSKGVQDLTSFFLLFTQGEANSSLH